MAEFKDKEREDKVMMSDADAAVENILPAIDADKNVIVVTDDIGNQQILRSLISNGDLQTTPDGIYILNNNQVLNSKNEQIVTLDGNLLIHSEVQNATGLDSNQVEMISDPVDDTDAVCLDDMDINDDDDFEEIYTHNMNVLAKKLDAVEQILNKFDEEQSMLDVKMNSLHSALVKAGCKAIKPERFPQEVVEKPILEPKFQEAFNLEEEYPDGSWLGNENDKNKRARCRIHPNALYNINIKSKTAVKMALTLLDHLFDRETLAVSNISGSSWHGKRKLSPILIYGIKSHLEYHFGISEKEWNRIKQNIDSKCRSAFRKKMRGLPLISKIKKEKQNLQTIEVNCDGEYVTYHNIEHFSGEVVVDQNCMPSDTFQQITSEALTSESMAEIPVPISDSEVKDGDNKL